MDYLKKLLSVIRGKRHPFYNRTVAHARSMTALITGEGMDDMMRQFSKREDNDLFKQRKRITQHITKTVCGNLIKPMYKIPRSNGAQRILMYKGDDGTRKDELEAILDKFWGRKSLDDWMNTRFIELNNIDPNTFIVLEWKDFNADFERARPYPFEVSSKDSLMFEKDGDILTYFVAFASYLDDNETERHRFTIYTPDFAIVATRMTDDEVRKMGMLPKMDQVFYFGGESYVVADEYGHVYKLEYPAPYNLGYVPAFQVGYKRDLFTSGMTYVSALDDAEPILMKMVKANSELDLTMALHTFPQKIQYVRRCSAPSCSHGELPDGSTCGECKGTGMDVHTSAQDVILLELPKNPEDVISLANIIRYESPPVDLVKFQADYIKMLFEDCKKAIYNSEIFSRQEVAETATGKNIDLQHVYDALYPLAEDYSYKWRFCVKTIADITDMTEGLIYEYFFPKDFKMKSLSELYLDLKSINDSKASFFVKQNIENDIALYIYQDDSREYLRYKTKQAFYPFSGRDEKEASLIVSSGLTTKFYEVLWANYGIIFDEIEREQYEKGVDFYRLTRPSQWEIIKNKVDSIIAIVDSEKKTIKPIDYDYQGQPNGEGE